MRLTSAKFDKTQDYRLDLVRIWEETGYLFMYVGINPSTADGDIDDATVKKWIGFSERNSARGFVVGNVFAYRATDVKKLAKVDDPVGRSNDENLQRMLHMADIIVPCWGSIKKVPERLRPRVHEVDEMIRRSGKTTLCFGVSKAGDPKHPLMLGYDTPLVEWPGYCNG